MQTVGRPCPTREFRYGQPPFPVAMQPTLQEIADAAVRDFDRRDSLKRVRSSAPGTRKTARRRIVRTADLPMAGPLAGRGHFSYPSLLSHEEPAPHKRYLVRFTIGLVVLVFTCLGVAWAHESTGWHNEEWSRRHQAILLQGTALHGQIRALSRQAERLDEKALIMTQYAADLRYSLFAYDAAEKVQQADLILADRDRLLVEIVHQRRRLAVLREEMAAHYTR